MAPTSDLPAKMKALVLESVEKGITAETVTTPQPQIGSAVVRVLSANVVHYTNSVYDGTRRFILPTPFIPGTSCVGRIAATGPDATKFKVGDLVFVDIYVRSRDDRSDVFLAGLHGGFSERSRRLQREVYRDFTYAEYCRAPLENIHLLDQKRILGTQEKGGLGYKLGDLGFLATLTVPYGGFRSIDLRAGQTVIIAPATGSFGGAAVVTALAMGCRVIAMGRNKDALEKMKATFPERLETVPITGDVETELAALQKFGQIDAFYDIGPKEAYNSSHIKAAIMALRFEGRVCLMGGYFDDIVIPHLVVMHKNIRLQGKWMYEREDVDEVVKLIETGVLKLGKQVGSRVIAEYPLEQWKEAFDVSSKHVGMGQLIQLTP